jgi:hypothetical protein
MLKSFLIRLAELPWGRLAVPLASAESALARLDERLRQSPIRDGWCERNRHIEAVSSMALEGCLVAMEDLVLGEAGRDIRTPTQELGLARAHLRRARRLAARPADATLTAADILALAGRTKRPAVSRNISAEDDDDSDDPTTDDEAWDAALADIDVLLARTDRVLAHPGFSPSSPLPTDLLPVPTPDRDDRLRRWLADCEATSDWPASLAAARALVVWNSAPPLPEEPGLGRLLTAALLRRRGRVRTHLVDLSSALRSLPRERQRHSDPLVRLTVVLEALVLAADKGLEDHDRRLTVREVLLCRIGRRNANSRLPRLIDLAITMPLVTSETISAELGVSTQAARSMVAELGLREITGRTRYQAWAVF